MSYVRLRYTPIVVGANATVKFSSSMIGGFLCTTSGTITISYLSDAASGTTVTLPTLTVTAGQWVNMPFYIGTNGGTVVAAGGAAGILGV